MSRSTSRMGFPRVSSLALPAVLLLGFAAPAWAATVHFGSLSSVTSASDLDTAGNFAYAINYTDAGSETSTYSVGDATFRPGSEAFSGASDDFRKQVDDWFSGPDYGGTTDDNQLEKVAQDMEFDEPSGSVDTAQIDLDVQKNATYKLQLLFHEGFHGSSGERIQDIDVEGSEAVDALDLVAFGSSGASDGVLFTYEFTAGDTNLDVGIAHDGDASDKNQILNGLTLETVAIPEPASLALLAPAGLALMRRRAGRNGKPRSEPML